MTKKSLIFIVCAILAALMITGCGDDPAKQYALHYDNGSNYFGNEEYKLAADEFKAAIELDEDNADAYYMLAMTYKQLDLMDDCEKILEKGIEKTSSKKLKELYKSYFGKAYGTKDDETTDDETTGEETTKAEETTEADTTVADTTAPVADTPQTQAQTQQQTQAVTNPSGNEILGQGAKDNPYIEIPVVGSGSMSVTTVPVPAGKSLYYSIQRIGGMIVTVNNANTYIVCNGQRYDAQGGVVSFTAPAALASDYITLEIGNKGGAAASFTLIFTNHVGTQANPVVIKTLGGQNKISLYEGDSDGYNYKYIAEKAGTIRFYITATTESIMSVTNNRNSSQRTTEADGQSDANGQYIEIQVNAGDELVIVVGAKPNMRGKYPATTITWSGKYN